MIKTIFFVLLGSISISSFSQNLTYYPKHFIDQINLKNPDQAVLREELFKITSGIHLQKENQNDSIVESCPKSEKCIQHQKKLTYKEARELMFGKLFLIKQKNQYFITDAYCEKQISEQDGVGPNKIPNPSVLNCEHTWPQSKFNPKFDQETQKVDLHHLFPVDSRSNSVRSNNFFGELDNARETHESCQNSSIGVMKGTNITAFLPPKNHRGNVARALFYFAIRYQTKISNEEEFYLKKWNQEDPIDQNEKNRNEEIFKIQGNRNPFIDYPQLGSILHDL